MSEKFNFRISEPVDRIIIIHFSGELTEETDSKIRSDIKDFISKEKKFYIFNMRELNYINSSGLGFLASTLKNVRKIHGDIKLAEIKPMIRNILDISKLTKVFDVFNKEEEALKALSANIDRNVY
jgi:anti-anti-sigma factor